MRLGILIGISALLTGLAALAIGHNPIFELLTFGIILSCLSYVMNKRETI